MQRMLRQVDGVMGRAGSHPSLLVVAVVCAAILLSCVAVFAGSDWEGQRAEARESLASRVEGSDGSAAASGVSVDAPDVAAALEASRNAPGVANDPQPAGSDSASARDQAGKESTRAQVARSHTFAKAAPPPEKKKSRDLSSKASGKTLRKVPKGKKLATFVAYGKHRKPAVKTASKRAIDKAIRAIERTGCECGAVLVDLSTGCGIAYNADKPLYTASAFKAPFVCYALGRAGKRGLDEGDKASAESAILHSSNDAYDALTFPRMGQDYIDWQEGYGITFDADTPFYVFASAASMTRIWADMYQYLKTGSKEAKWFGNLLAHTNRSPIRDAVGKKGVTVRNKAGWISEEYDAVTDCAYIDAKGRPYLMAIMTDQPSSTAAFERVSSVASQLFAARACLR